VHVGKAKLSKCTVGGKERLKVNKKVKSVRGREGGY
jgi:hypothetical protein